MYRGDFVIICPHCGCNPAAFEALREPIKVESSDGGHRRWRLTACPACGRAVAFESTPDSTDRYIGHTPEAAAPEWEVSHLPDDVARDWSEAVRVYEVGAHEAAVVMCGRTLEAGSDRLGISGRSLQARIKKMLDEDLITSSFGGAMNYVRVIRNVGAHAGQPVEPATAEGTMRFTLQALRLLFEVPGELERLTEPPEAQDDPADAESPGKDDNGS
jgi:uncharacterized protein DUF4145